MTFFLPRTRCLLTLVCLAVSISLSYAQLNYEPNIMVATVAGTSTSGTVDGQGTDASFSGISGIVTDEEGMIYLIDNGLHIRKVSPSGLVETWVGGATSGSTNGQGTDASFFGLTGIARNAATGDFYVTESFNHKIRKVTADGMVSDFAGSGTWGNTDGQGADATLSYPVGIAINSEGDLFVTSSYSSNIRKITPDGQVTLFAGHRNGMSGNTDAQGTEARFYNPTGIVVDRYDNLFVVDQGNNKIRKITPEGIVSSLAGAANGPVSWGKVDGQGEAARFNRPQALGIDANGNLFVTEINNELVRKVTPSGLVTTIAGSPTASVGNDDGPGPSAKFNSARSVAASASGILYVGNKTALKKITNAIVTNSQSPQTMNASVYPNPARELFVVSSPELIGATLTLSNLQGHELIRLNSEEETIQFPVADLTNGVYLMKLVRNDQSFVQKVVIAR